MNIYQCIGQRIRARREALSLSQDELGERIGGYTGTAISYFESGVRKVKIEDLQKIAKVLKYPLDYFLKEESVLGEGALEILLRTQPLLHPAAFQQVQSFVESLKGRVNKQKQRIRLSGVTPRIAAAHLLELMRVDEPPVSEEKAARAVGIPVIEGSFADEISAFLIKGDDLVVIGVNKKHSPVRYRFSVAHELGHALLEHSGHFFVNFSSPALEPPNTNEEQEREANWFAADLLMPVHLLRKDFKVHGADVRRLAEKYGVSEQALWFRLINLRLVNGADYPLA